METYENKVRELELIEFTKDYTEFKNGFKKIKNWAEEKNQPDKAYLAQYEIDICSLVIDYPALPKEKNKKRLCPLIVQGETSWPDVEKFTDEQFKYYEQRLVQTENIFLKVRYADFLFENKNNSLTKNKYQISQYLLCGLMEISKYYQNSKEYREYFLTMARMIEVSQLMNNKEKLKESIESIDLRIIEWNNEAQYGWIIKLSELLREVLNKKHSKLVPKDAQNHIVNVLRSAKKKIFNTKEYELYRLVCTELVHYHKFNLISSTDKRDLQLEIGESYELEGEYQQGRENKSLGVKALYLDNAMEIYSDIGESQKIKEMKVLVKKTYEQLDQSDEVKAISFSTKISPECIDKIIEPYISSDLQKNLDRISLSNSFIPKINEIKSQIAKLPKDTPLLDQITKNTLSDDRKIEQASTKEEIENHNFINHYILQIEIIVETFIKPIFEQLINMHGLRIDSIMEKFDRWELLDNRNRSFIEAGVKRFFKEDYISSLHILVPQFESTLRNLFAKLDYPTTSIKKNTTQQEQTFNVFLEHKEVRHFLGEDIHQLLKIIMVEQTGLNLRNKIAHGFIKFSELTKSQCCLVIYLFLILTRFSGSSNK